jgi:hypothetical protein
VSEQLLRSLSQASLSQASGAGASAVVRTILLALGANLLVAVATSVAAVVT